MKRRNVLKNLVLGAGGLVTLPAWAQGWNEISLAPLPKFLSAAQEAVLAEVVETIIPANDTPGAKDLKIDIFVQKMMADCYEPEIQQSVVKGLATTEQLAQQTYGLPFTTCNTHQREEILTRLEISIDPNWSSYFKLIKELTLQGYLTSEYYLTQHTNYKMVPGHFYGCVPVPSNPNPVQK
jgi:hypothetical protein